MVSSKGYNHVKTYQHDAYHTTGTLRQRQRWLLTLTLHMSQYLKDANKMERVVDNYDGEEEVRTDGLATEQAVLWFFVRKRREKAVLTFVARKKRKKAVLRFLVRNRRDKSGARNTSTKTCFEKNWTRGND